MIALKYFNGQNNYRRASEGDSDEDEYLNHPYKEEIVFTESRSPHSILWENRDVSV